VALLVLTSCGDSTSVSSDDLTLNPVGFDLGAVRDTVIEVHNNGNRAIGPIQLSVGSVFNTAGNTVTGPVITLTPTLIATLNPGASATVAIDVDVPGSVPEDTYSTFIDAFTADFDLVASAELSFTVHDPLADDVAGVAFTATGPTTLRQGDLFRFGAEARDASGQVIAARILWSVVPASGGFVSDDGRFVGYAGTPRVVARAGAHADTVQLSVTPRGLAGSFTVVGRGTVLDRVTSDLWIHGDAAYTGTWGSRVSGGTERFGNTLNTWDVSDPANPSRTSSITVDARTVNDVKIRSDGVLGLITHEGSNDRLNGVTLLDLSDPLRPTVISRTTTSLETGIHNAWIEGDFMYLVVDGTSPSSGLRVLDISDPASPQIVADFYGGSSFLHDVYVRDGLAFLSHWSAGLIILDVGSGLAGGSPGNPFEVSRVLTQGGETHNAWYWPAGGYVFVGEEDFNTPGIMHVVDVSDMRNPREVATFAVPGTTPHNFWMDETAEVLYLSWYDNGIRALDVSGELLGALDRQGREIDGFLYAQATGAQFPARNWAPQFHQGLLYLSDMDTGLWILQPNF
jgi:hypothetical protein